jgi:hypothetical protein
MINRLFLFLLIIILIIILVNKKYESFENIKPHVYWTMIHIPKYTERNKNLKNTQKKFNFIKYSPAFYKLEECCQFLAKQNIKINPSYWNHSKDIHLGKIGNTCSVLNFLIKLKDNKYDYGVWIEDDLILEKNNIDFINQEINKPFKKPMKRLQGVGLEVIIVKTDMVDMLLKPFREKGIYNPPDVLWDSLKLIQQTENKVKKNG